MRQSWQNVPAGEPTKPPRRSPRSSIASSPPLPRAEPELDFQLTDEQRLISETAREFADKEIAPRVRDNDRAGRFDRELASMIGEMGYLGATVSEEYGGRSLDYLSYALIVEQVGRGDSSGSAGGAGRPPPPPVRSSRCRRRWSPDRSSAGAPRSRSANGCRDSVRERHS